MKMNLGVNQISSRRNTFKNIQNGLKRRIQLTKSAFTIKLGFDTRTIQTKLRMLRFQINKSLPSKVTYG